MKSGEIWICSDHCCFGLERDFPHYVRIVAVKIDVVEYSIIDHETGESMPMVVGGSVERGGVEMGYSDTMEREEFVYYYNKLRDAF